ncbi:MAG: sulfite exporter TauE/SafE family protein [Bacteroidota bacterium]
MSFILALLAAFVIGLGKSGLKGLGVVIVTLMAYAYGAKASTGIVLPLLIFADIMAVYYYNRHAKWNLLMKFLPWMIAGVVFGAYLGKDLPEDVFKKGMAAIILISVIIMFAWEHLDKKKIPKGMWFAGSTGFTAGFTTMIGNLAGAFSNIFFLAMRIPKDQFIGTAAWLYFIINIFKLPFHVFSWGTVNMDSLKTDLYLIPAVVLGFVLGIKLVKYFGEKQYRTFILVMTGVGALVMLVR